MPSASRPIPIASLRISSADPPVAPADRAHDPDLADPLEDRHRHRVHDADAADDQCQQGEDPARRDDQAARCVDLDDWPGSVTASAPGTAARALRHVVGFRPSWTVTPIVVTSPGAAPGPGPPSAAGPRRGRRTGRPSGRARDPERPLADRQESPGPSRSARSAVADHRLAPRARRPSISTCRRSGTRRARSRRARNESGSRPRHADEDAGHVGDARICLRPSRRALAGAASG